MVDVIFPEESYRIIGACFEVYNELGPGLRKLSTRNVWSWNYQSGAFRLYLKAN